MNDPECVIRKVKISPHDYSKENLLATFTPQKQLTPEQIFWSNDLMKLKSEALKERTKACYLQEVIPFFKTLKDNFEGIQKALTKEVKEMKDVFEELEAKVAQYAVDRKHDAVELKNLLIANDNLIAERLSQEVFCVATNSELNVARFTEMLAANTTAETRCLALELQVTRRDTYRALQVQTTDSQITKLTDQVTKLTTENMNMKNSVSKATVNPLVSARDKHVIDVEPIVPRLRNNRNAHLDYLRHLKESVETIHDIVEEAKVVRPLDRSIVSACRYTKHFQELLEYVIGTCPQGSQPHAKQLAYIPLIRKKQVIITQPSNKLDSTTHLHVVTVTSQKTNVPVPPSTGVNSCPIARGSHPKSHVKPNTISPAKGDNKLPVDVQPRKNKSHPRTSNRIDSSSRLKRIATDSQITKLTDQVTHLQAQNDLFGAENDKIKQHYKELYDFIKITHAKHIKQMTNLTNENVNLKTYVSKATVNPQVSARDKHAIDVEPIVPRLRNNRDAYLDYLRHLKESVERIRDIVKEAKVVRPLDRSIVFACRVNSCPNASGSQPKSHVKPNKISLAKGDNKLPVDDQPRKNKSHLRTSNCIDSSSRLKRTVSSGASGAPRASKSAQMLPSPPLPSSINQESPSKGSAAPNLEMDKDMAPDEQAQSSDDEDIGSITSANHYHWGVHLVIIQSDFFFNKDLEYLRYGSKGCRPALSISKMKAAYYPDAGLEQMVPDQFWIEEECKYDIVVIAVRTHMRILSVVRIEVFSMYGYDYIKKIVLRCADLNEHVIAKQDFKYLYPSDFEDLYLLNLQGHLNHLPPKDKKILTTAFNQWTRQLVIRQHVEDFQLGIESYQTQDKYGVQMMMCVNEIHKFSDGTLQQIDEALDYRVKEFRINKLNPGLNTRFWTRKDVD
nr:hypothetical protein [Tanacetum cinerariifolium]